MPHLPLCLLFILFLNLPGPATGQNLVPNPGFEDFHQCPPYPGQIQEARSWDAPNNKTTDFFHRCSPPQNGAGVPANLLGYQEPYRGDGYAGIRTWIPIIEGNPIYREYLVVELLEPLVAGEEYEIGFWLSLAENAGYLSNDIGMHLAVDPFDARDHYQLNPQLQFTADVPLEDTESWYRISTKITAAGGEQHLILGNFLDDATMTRTEIDASSPLVYYYIDEVFVRPCVLYRDSTVVIDTSFCPGVPLLLAGPDLAGHYQWSTGSEFPQQIIRSAGNYELTADFGCYRQMLTYRVTEKDCSCGITVLNPQSARRPIQWQLSPVVSGLRFRIFNATGQLVHESTDLQAPTACLPAGIYFWQAEMQCEGNVQRSLAGNLLMIN